MKGEGIEGPALALWDGRITENEFVRQTMKSWQRTAAYLFSTWRRKLPSWVEVVDVQQEIVVLAIEYVRRWDPSRNSPIGKFVTWSAIHRTQRAMNVWRGASTHGREGANPSRVELAFSRVYGADVDPFAKLSPMHAEQDAMVARSERFAGLLEDATARQAVVLALLRAADGSVEQAAQLAASDVVVLAELGATTAEQARKIIVKELGQIVDLDALSGEGVMPPDDLWEGWGLEVAADEEAESSDSRAA